MVELIHADIFFFITTISIVVVSVGLLIVLFFVIRILNNISSVSKRFREEGEEIITDLHLLRTDLKKGGSQFKHFFRFLKSFLPKTVEKKEKAEK